MYIGFKTSLYIVRHLHSRDKYKTLIHCGQNLQLLNIKNVGTSRNQ